MAVLVASLVWALAPAANAAKPRSSTPRAHDGRICAIAPADGQAAIAAAIKKCPNNSTVSFPARRTYHQTGKILVDGRSGLTIDGNGSTFVKTSPSVRSLFPPRRMNWQLTRNTNIVLRDMTIRGAFGGCTPRCPDNKSNQYDHGVEILGGYGATIRDVKVHNVYGEFVSAGSYGGTLGAPARNVRIERLIGKTAKRQCVSAIGAIGFWLEDSRLADCHQNGVDVEASSAGQPTKDVHILRNRIDGTYFSAITVPNARANGDVNGVEIRGTVTGVAPDSCYPPILVGEKNLSNANPFYHVTVADNRVVTKGDGIVYRRVVVGSITGNHVAITKRPSYCASTRGDPTRSVRLIDTWQLLVARNTAVGYPQ